MLKQSNFIRKRGGGGSGLWAGSGCIWKLAIIGSLVGQMWDTRANSRVNPLAFCTEEENHRKGILVGPEPNTVNKKYIICSIWMNNALPFR